MQVLFESRAADGAQLRELMLGRVHVAMRRLAPQVMQARVQLSDVNGPRGGIDKRCTLALQTQDAGTLVVVATASAWRTAFEQALARVARALVRAWQRKRKPRHHAARRADHPAFNETE